MTISRRAMIWRSAMSVLGVVAAKLGFKAAPDIANGRVMSFGMYPSQQYDLAISYLDYTEPPTLVDVYAAGDDGVFHKISGVASIASNTGIASVDINTWRTND